MELTIRGLEDGGWIPERFAFGVPDAAEHMRLGENCNPGIAWHGSPPGTRSLVLIVHDDDVPARADDVNQEGRTIPQDFARTRFYHWVMVDLPPGAEEILEAAASREVTPHGKDKAQGPKGGRQGLNGFTGFLEGDPDMAGKYFGYDGPCPPWNDERMHRYHFTLYATDFDPFPLEGEFDGTQVEAALEGHVLGSARVTGRYSLYPPLMEKPQAD
ncbi:MAG: YbhB/YbcL family Raf kinase inhibitor-like protein [Gammaproteobacteria bacterium]